MTIQRIDASERMSQAVIHNDVVHLAGQVGAKGEPVEEQLRTVLANIDSLLARAGSDKARILSATIWLADMADFGTMNEIWDAWIDPAYPPARATGEVRLAAPEYKVEIIIIAACG